MIWSWFKRVVSYDAKVSRFNIITLGIVGFFGHPLYWTIWTYLFPQPYDSAALRFLGALVCFFFIIKDDWPKPLKPYFPWYWFWGVSYVLPFIFTVHLVMNDFSTIWLMCQVVMIFIVAIFTSNFF